ncbi:MAG: lipoprotein [gamma proteobacterium endosymbiont of Lamellibrachia anaximandri]|nr:lipoprotein [gamma proteobacterium endosymbiont of Lamellibrachia anaximandri]
MTCWPKALLWLVIAVLGSGNLLSACGQKGPLYLPPAEEVVDQQDKEKKR